MGADIQLWIPAFLAANVTAILWVFLGKRVCNNLGVSLRTPKKKSEDVALALPRSTRVPPVTLLWKRVKCVHTIGRRERRILHDVSGRAFPGELVALMGPSGAGKSTLLDILSMRKNTGTVSGDILINGVPRERHHLHLTSYVSQDDVFVPSLTCLETLQFYSGLMLHGMSGKQRLNRIQDVFEELDLLAHQQTLVGGLLPGGIRLKGLSGGQKRRLSIAIGIISSPSIVFMDEPTSGLDSFAAVSTMRFVKELALKRNHTIIATIHQPRLDIWRLLSRVLLLSKGLLMYEGTSGQIHGWFSGYLGYSYNANEDGAIPDWCLDLVSIDFAKPQDFQKTIRTEADLVNAARSFAAVYDISEGLIGSVDSEDGSQRQSPLTFFPAQASNVVQHSSNIQRAAQRTSLLEQWMRSFRQFMMLSWRSAAFVTRNPASIGGRLFTIAWVAASVGTVFYNIPDTPQSISTRFNVLFMAALVLILFPYLSVSHATADKVYFLSDMSSKLYSPLIYYISKTLVQFPFQLVNVFVFVVIVYGMTGLRSDSYALAKQLILLALAFLIFSQVLNFAAVLAPSEDLTFIVGVCFVAFNLMFCDFFIHRDQMRFPWLGSLSAASPMNYIFEGLTQIEFRDRSYYTACQDDFEEIYGSLTAHQRASLPIPKQVITYVLRSMSNDEGLCVVSGNGLLQWLGHHRSLKETILVLVGFLFGVHLVTFLVLCHTCKNPVKK